MTTNSRIAFAIGTTAGVVLVVVGVALRVAAVREHDRCLAPDLNRFSGASVLANCDDPSSTGIVVAVLGVLVLLATAARLVIGRRNPHRA
ncbi:hypothetical protein [Williamsia herbipolensis]|uniref:hypothetical protein n=1 Tax=Williamsia herbipolensis TaxID=1603258 RepID=UPI0005F885CB|nr:hypothetical protein [Williamsia herbipolensis]